MRRWQLLLLIGLALLELPMVGLANGEPIRIGSKNFSEGYLLAEIMAQQLEASGYAVERRFGLGGTLICYGALVEDEIDLYSEYTGTLAQAILKLEDLSAAADLERLRRGIASRNQLLLDPFGFDNTYALALPKELAQARGLRTISDLAQAPDLRLVFSHEFMERLDGWPGLAAHYALPQVPRGIEHAIAYQALEEDAADVTDAYSTDGELIRYGLVSLIDDRAFFPDYRAAPLIRNDVPEGVLTALGALAGIIDEAEMQALNAQVVFEKKSFGEVAQSFLIAEGLLAADAAETSDFTSDSWQAEMGRNTVQHLRLTGIALGLAIVLALSLSLAVFRHPRVAQSVLYTCSLLQTIPSIALLALLLPVFKIGMVPAIVALLLYALLPIVRNTLSALRSVDPTLIRVSRALGMSNGQQLRHLYLPLALPSIFAGIRTAAVICIGTATLAAFVGAGGLGSPIVTGLSLNNTSLILQGAVPAAGLAVLTELVFEGLERALIPAHRRGQG